MSITVGVPPPALQEPTSEPTAEPAVEKVKEKSKIEKEIVKKEKKEKKQKTKSTSYHYSEGRVAAFKKCQEARKASLEAKRAAKSTLIKLSSAIAATV